MAKNFKTHFRIKKISAKNKKTLFLNKKRTYEQILKAIRSTPPSKDLNIDFYKNSEGVYSSYWLGKLINTLQTGGNKKIPAKHLYNAFIALKFNSNNSPLLLFLETIDKIKPVFKLRNYIVRRVIIKEYPIAVLRPRKLILAIHWIKEELRSSANKFNFSLTQRVVALLKDFISDAKKSNLSKKRDAYIKRSVKAQFNIRYTFR